MSDISLPRYACNDCGRLVDYLDICHCGCGQFEGCAACFERLSRYHRSGDCGIDQAFEEALAKD
jgi:hypothetical protein